MNFRSYRDYIEKSKIKKDVDSYNLLTNFELDIDGKKTKITLPENYHRLIKSIREKINLEIKLSNVEHTKGNHALKIFNILDCKPVIQIGNHFAKELSKKLYNTEVVVDIVHTYKSINRKTNFKKSSWLWHYDNASPGQIKIMIYLNDVSNNNGCFQVMTNNDKCYLYQSSKVSPNLDQGAKTRITSEFINYLNANGYKPYDIVGPAGTFIVFNQNILHRATVPTKSPEREVIIFNFRPYYKPVNFHIDKNFTFGWKNQITKFVKAYPYKIKYID